MSAYLAEFRRNELRREGEANGVVEYGCDLFRGEDRELGVWVSGPDRSSIDAEVVPLAEKALADLDRLVSLVPRPPSRLATIAVSPGRVLLTFWEDGVNNEFTASFSLAAVASAPGWSFDGFGAT
ncbi:MULTISPECIES: hypothetical protein [Microbacterium]|uniref:hypothetical protein n=1 Tax=Microbacterium TaxID=33882 RepID=UPI0023DA4369|nr:MULTISPECIES: hypothetical protein [Microbacterium]MDF2046564.1 hypothetical protein [Microbacterium sp. Kw_RZR3]MDQ1074942.1 hypothetical protein [Microbacterium sp. SORGH_AS_0969]MDQ1115168.1 hypothetical protein [Microbacterium testaceum]